MDKPNWEKIYLVFLWLAEQVKIPIEARNLRQEDINDVLVFLDRQAQRERNKKIREEQKKRNVSVCRKKR